MAGLLVLAGLLAPKPQGAQQPSVTFAQAQAVITQRCVPCHSATPTQPGFPDPPFGIRFDKPEEIVVRAQQINQQAVVQRTMPLGNLTNMTEQERDLIGAWVAAGAPGP